MALTSERAEVLANYLSEDMDRAKFLLELSPKEAMEQINANGYDFAIEEIADFGKLLQVSLEKNGELDENALSEVAGGIVVEGVAIACITLGFKIGSDLAERFGW